MSIRINELESALFQQSGSDQPSSAVDPKSPAQDNFRNWDPALQEVSEAIGSLSVGLDGQVKYHGASAGSEACCAFTIILSGYLAHLSAVLRRSSFRQFFLSPHLAVLVIFLQMDEGDLQPLPDPKFLGLSYELVDLMNTFPFGLKDSPYHSCLHKRGLWN